MFLRQAFRVRIFVSVIMLLSILAAVRAHAVQEMQPQMNPVKIFLQAGDQVSVKGFRGEVLYTVDEKAKDITVSMTQQSQPKNPQKVLKYQDEWQFSFKRNESEIQIFIDGPASKQAWSEILISNEIPEYYLKITGPSVPLNINWNVGRINVQNLNSELHIVAQKADIQVNKGEGDLDLTTQEGLIKVKDHKGKVTIDSYLAKVDVSNLDGQLKLENFTGESLVQNINGQMELSSFKGSTRIAGLTGRLDFKNGNSSLYIEKFEGELRGRSGQGAIYADVLGEADVRLESAEGPVNLKLASSGAWVNLGTAEGALAVPNFLKLTRMPAQQIRTGKLHGTKSGSVFVRTTTGDIRIK
jgi:hypothetical protein